MTPTLLFAAVVVFVFVVGRALERFASRRLLLSAAVYVLAGAALAPLLPWLSLHLDLLALDLLISIGLGAVGFFVGLRLRSAKIADDAFLAGLTATAGVIVVVGAAMTEAIELLDPIHSAVDPIVAVPIGVGGDLVLWLWVTPIALWVGLSVGAAAGGTSSAVVDVAIARFAVSETRARFLRGMAAAGEVMALFAFGTAMAASRAATSASELGLTITEWLLVTVAAGACTGLLFIVFLGHEGDSMRMSVATAAVVVFASGVGVALGVSPLLVNLIAGVTVARAYGHADRLEAGLHGFYFPVSVLVLVLAGLTWVPVSGWFWLLVPGYALLRAVSRRVSSRLSAVAFVAERALAVDAGHGLAAQGVVAAAISLAFAQRFPELAGPVTTTILGGMVLTDLLATRSIRRYLADAGEIQPLSGAPGKGSA